MTSRKHIVVLLLQEPDGGWLAMCEAQAKMRPILGATLIAAQSAVREQYANPVPLRFPEDFPFMPREFLAMKRCGTLVGSDETFTWYRLDREARLRALHNQL